MKTVAIIQARLGSTRLPGKVLKGITGKPMLAHVVERVRRASNVDLVLIATTDLTRDDPLAQFCEEHDYPYSRGSESDVLDRYYHAAQEFEADLVVRITSDCPLIDPDVIEQAITEHKALQPDYTSNFVPDRTFPRGLDVEVFSWKILERIWREDNNPAWREHVTCYIDFRQELFNIHCMKNEIDYSELRWTVDQPEDLELIRRIYSHFNDNDFSWLEVLKLFQKYPELKEINRNVEQKVIHE